MVLGVIALIVQAGSCLFVGKRPISLGFLNLSLALLVLLATASFYSGRLVLAHEFGLIFVQGQWPTVVLRGSLVLVTMLPGLAWYRVRVLNNWQTHLWPFLVSALFIGLWSASRAFIVNGVDPEPLRIRAYDCWWPPLVIWFIVSFSAIVLAIFQNRNWLLLFAVATAILQPIAEFAQYWPSLADPQSGRFWFISGRASFAFSASALTYFVSNGISGRLRALSLTCAALSGLIFAFAPMSGNARSVIGMVPLFAIVLGLAVATIIEFRKRKSTGMSLGLGRVAPALSLVCVFAVLLDIFSIEYLGRWLAITVLLGLWVFLVERLAEGVLYWVPNMFKGGVLQLSGLKVIWGWLKSRLAAAKQTSKATVTFFTTGSAWAILAKTLVVPILLVICLATLTELVTDQKIVIKHFRWVGEPKDTISENLAEALVNELGQLRKDLLPEVIIAQHGAPGENPVSIKMFSAGADTNTLESAVAKSDDIQIANLRIPLTYLVGPIQQLVRIPLGVRVIDGTVQKTASSGYMVMANANGGESWREFSGIPTKKPTQSTCLTDDESEALIGLAKSLAFDIAKSDPSFVNAGLTKNKEALEAFRVGIKHWNSYDSNHDAQNELLQAVACFREAVRQDRQFSLAQYRLGLAMLQRSQPEAALDAFRTSVEANSRFISAWGMLAATLYDFNDYYGSRPAGLPPLEPDLTRRDEAFRIWAFIAARPWEGTSIAERLSANLGLCRYQLDQANQMLDQSQKPDRRVYAAYFFCGRVAQLFYRLSRPGQQDAQERNVFAAALNNLGVTLEFFQRFERKYPRHSDWSCMADAVDASLLTREGEFSNLIVAGSKYSRAAAGYYKKSLAVNPEDPAVQCNRANSEHFLNIAETNPMKELRGIAKTRSLLASALAAKAKTAAWQSAGDPHRSELVSGFYQLSLSQDEIALSLNPASLDALNGYAYTYWEWALSALEGRTLFPPDQRMGLRAEELARDYIQVAHNENLRQDEVFAENILGEVLLAQGRNLEAIPHLETAVRETEKYSWDGLSESRWDLAQAQLCASRTATDGKQRELFVEQAMEQYQKIRSAESETLARPFSRADGMLDIAHRASICPNSRNSFQGNEQFQFVTDKPIYQSGLGCTWLAVGAEIRERAGTEVPYYLHVWGGGLNERVPALPLRAIQVEASTPAIKHIYFAQLENISGQQLSATISFAVPNVSKSHCSKNRLKLVFRDVHQP